MRRADRIKLEAKEDADALACCCAACHAKAGEACTPPRRRPHRVRLGIGRWAAAKLR